MSDPLQPHRLCSPLGSFVHGILQAGEWLWLPRSPPGDLPNSGIKPASTYVSLAGRFFATIATWEAPSHAHVTLNARVKLRYKKVNLHLFHEG